MKNTLIGMTFLAVLWLSGCGSSATPENVPGATLTSTTAAGQENSNTGIQPENSTTASSGESGMVIQLTKAEFLEKVYDYENNPKKWSFKGNKPCVIDFYADWCRPCKMVAPIMAELADKYKGEITIYRVNTDQERELAQFFGIRSIPTLFFCPATGDPQMTQGALAKDQYEKIITEVLLKKK